ncbi:hypothetical protein N657DRAFT_692029 [Parathielavia appendiculata]|uniref:Uncharacterized protein n=1 Tax=Parathielavia appendiculata TaxID=2587402 RepID=A0AAN6Z0X8_9PEZI|nr:hypothetical protein N657DRAFT_692029 [Parathielavia appendiculata]
MRPSSSASLFQSRYPSSKSAAESESSAPRRRLGTPAPKSTRGYGFVGPSDESDKQRALLEMQEMYCGNRPMRILTATPKTRSHYGMHNKRFGRARFTGQGRRLVRDGIPACRPTFFRGGILKVERKVFMPVAASHCMTRVQQQHCHARFVRSAHAAVCLSTAAPITAPSVAQAPIVIDDDEEPDP